MFYKNLTFTEAKDLFPRTQSQYRLAEKQQQFPDLPRLRRPAREERIELSFPRKTTEDLKKQYCNYLRINQGIIPVTAASSETQSFSEVDRRLDSKTPTKVDRSKEDSMKGKKPPPRKEGPGGSDTQIRNEGGAFDLIRALSHKLTTSYTDSDQPAGSSISNDLMLIDIGRMVTEFLMMAKRDVVSYSDREEYLVSEEEN